MRLVTVSLAPLLSGADASAVVLDAAGHGVAATRQARHGEGADQAAASRDLWPLLQPMTLQEIHRRLRRHRWLPGIGDGVARLRQEGLDVRLLTGQPSTIAEFAGRWGFGRPIASPVHVADGRQQSIDRRDKLVNLHEHCKLHDLNVAEVCHVGHGSSDVAVFRAVGRSVAVFSDPEAAAADVSLPEVASFMDVVHAVLS